MAWLRVNSAKRELADRPLVVGSGARAGWRVQGADLCARHFVIEGRDDRWSVRLYSTQEVVAVNGRQLGAEPVELRDGDVIAAGNGWFGFSLETPPPGQALDLRPPRSPAPHLVNDDSRRAWTLDHASSAIGSDPANVVVLHDRDVPLFHAEIRRESGGYALHAIDSSGLRLNGRTLRMPMLLREGDTIEIARTALRFTTVPLPAEVLAASDDASPEPAPAGSGGVRTVSFQMVPESDTDALSAVALRPGRTMLAIAALLVVVAMAVAWLTR